MNLGENLKHELSFHIIKRTWSDLDATSKTLLSTYIENAIKRYFKNTANPVNQMNEIIGFHLIRKLENW